MAGVVFDEGGRVLSGGSVLRLRHASYTERVAWLKTSEPEVTLPVDADGRFARTGLATGEWWAEVDVPGRMPRIVGFAVGEAGAGTAIALGDGVVEGRLYDREGKALADHRVTASRGPVDGPLSLFVETRTATDGAFRIDGLVAGPWWLVGYLGADSEVRVNRTERVVVVPGVPLTHDLGIPRAERRWSGVVRTRSGKSVRGGGGAAVFLIEKAVSRAHGADIDAEGRFSDRFPAGVHSVAVIYLGGSERKPIELGEITIDADMDRDVTLPGSRLSGRVVSPAGSLPRDQRVYFRKESPTESAKEAVTVTPAGEYVLDGLLAGRYRLEGFPLALVDSRGDPPIVEMSDDRPEVALDLVAKSP